MTLLSKRKSFHLAKEYFISCSIYSPTNPESTINESSKGIIVFKPQDVTESKDGNSPGLRDKDLLAKKSPKHKHSSVQKDTFITRNISIENEAQSDTLRENEALLSENSYSLNKEIPESMFSTSIYRNRNTVTV